MKFSAGEVHDYPVAANAVIRVGEGVIIDANGYAAPMAVASGQKFAGISTQHVDNTGGANAAKTVTVLKRGIVDVGIAGGLSQPSVGAAVYYNGYSTSLFSPSVHGTATGRTQIGTLVTFSTSTGQIALGNVV